MATRFYKLGEPLTCTYVYVRANLTFDSVVLLEQFLELRWPGPVDRAYELVDPLGSGGQDEVLGLQLVDPSGEGDHR